MNMPDSKQAMRIRWYGLWLNPIVSWYAFDHYTLEVTEALSCHSERSEPACVPTNTPGVAGRESWHRRYKIFLPINRDRNDKFDFLDSLDISYREAGWNIFGNPIGCKIRYPFPIRNISGQVKTLRNDIAL